MNVYITDLLEYKRTLIIDNLRVIYNVSMTKPLNHLTTHKNKKKNDKISLHKTKIFRLPKQFDINCCSFAAMSPYL